MKNNDFTQNSYINIKHFILFLQLKCFSCLDITWHRTLNSNLGISNLQLAFPSLAEIHWRRNFNIWYKCNWNLIWILICVGEDREDNPNWLRNYVIWHIMWNFQCCLNDLFFWGVGLAYWCNLSICMVSQNAEWVQIAVMKLFHYGDEQCWTNRNNKAECFIEPSVEVLWQEVLLCLQHWWLPGGQRWVLAKWNNSHLQLPLICKHN